jgi:hypothetical protein
MEDSSEISFAKEEVPGICFLLRGMDRLPMEPMLEEYWEDLARIGDAKFDSWSWAPGLNTWVGRPISEIWGLETSGGAGGFTISYRIEQNTCFEILFLYQKLLITQHPIFILVSKLKHLLNIFIRNRNRQVCQNFLEISLNMSD